jgi:hypothetical protein
MTGAPTRNEISAVLSEVRAAARGNPQLGGASTAIEATMAALRDSDWTALRAAGVALQQQLPRGPWPTDTRRVVERLVAQVDETLANVEGRGLASSP